MQQKEKKKLRQINIAVLGPQGHGKSRVIQWLTGHLKDQNQDPAVKQLGPQEDSKHDESEKAQEYVSTLRREHYYFFYLRNHINIFDLPGQADSIAIKLQGLLGIQTVIFVVSASKQFEVAEQEIKQLMMICEFNNVKKIVFAINFMDVFPDVNWSKPRYEYVKNRLTEFCSKIIIYKKEPLQIDFAPTCGQYGQNILRNNSQLEKDVFYGVSKWIKDEKIPSLIEVFENFIILKGKTQTFRETKEMMRKKPLRVTVVGVIPAQNPDDQQFDQSVVEDVSGVFAYIHSGKLRRDTKLIFQPVECYAIVKSIEYFTPAQVALYQKLKPIFDEQRRIAGQEPDSLELQEEVPRHASTGSLCYIKFHNRERIRIPIGAVGGIPIFKKIPQLANMFTCKFKILNKNFGVYYNSKFDGLFNLQRYECKIYEVQSVLDPKLGKINLLESNFNKYNGAKLNSDSLHQVRIQILNDNAVQIEQFSFIPSCGKVFFFSKDTLVAAGVIEEVSLKYENISYLPRLFAVPNSQILDASTNKKTDHWANCQICFSEPINSLLVPCGHIRTCYNCSKKILNICPFCKLQVKNTIKMQIIALDEEIELMSFANCDCCAKKRFTHQVTGCEHSNYICQDCVQEQCKICMAKDHMFVKIFI